MNPLDDHDMLLLRLAIEDGGRIDIGRILDRRPGSQSRVSLSRLIEHEYVAIGGVVTPAGRRALDEWVDPMSRDR